MKKDKEPPPSINDASDRVSHFPFLSLTVFIFLFIFCLIIAVFGSGEKNNSGIRAKGIGIPICDYLFILLCFYEG